MEFESKIRTKLVLQARTRRRDADALLQCRQRGLRQAAAVVAHFYPELVVVLPRTDIDVARSKLLRHAVLDGVLDQRLQEQRWQQRVKRLGLDVEPDDQ